MTIEELLGLPTPTLEAISDADLERHLRQYFPATRPASRLENAIALAVDQRKVIAPGSAVDNLEKRILEKYEREQAERAAASRRIPLAQLSSKVPPAK